MNKFAHLWKGGLLRSRSYIVMMEAYDATKTRKNNGTAKLLRLPSDEPVPVS